MKGIGVSPGIAVGRAVIHSRQKFLTPRKPAGGTQDELARLELALAETRRQLNDMVDKITGKLGRDEAKIFQAQLLVLDDPMFVSRVQEYIQKENLSAEQAVDRTVALLVERFGALKDPYLRERAADIKDIGQRLLRNLTGSSPGEKQEVKSGVLFALDLTPSETSLLDTSKILGLVLEEGSKTSHTSILACALNIPAVVGVKGVLTRVHEGDTVIVDGDNGCVVICPDERTLESYRYRLKKEREKHRVLEAVKNLPAVTPDGFQVKVAANIGGPQEAAAVLSAGGEGVGLFRTEFLFLDRHTVPSEQEQFEVYKEVLAQLAPHQVIIRTMDIGGDKEVPFLARSGEQNPFLGLRAIRLCLRNQELFYTQLRAVLRAGVFGKAALMLPMVSDVMEVKQTREIIGRLREELASRGEKVVDEIPLGIMVETPAAAIMAEELAREVDFFSIGTNDLVQYVLAVDRLNEEVSYLYQPFHPAVLRLIQQVVRAAHRFHKWVGVCGEMAADPLAVPLLLGMGVDELSMSPGSIPVVKNLIRQIRKSDASELSLEVTKLTTAGEVVEKVRNFMRERVGEGVCQDCEGP
ncbi:phosphoenolpyruvate--protein phosphotransferase [Desulfofundulus sp.]|uniref:phosphoenolpyruvate--protein phosphotransferase n=1 Tax=Desulfofundulus sp. TaxID=2282750 RepID=UPI003C77160F